MNKELHTYKSVGSDTEAQHEQISTNQGKDSPFLKSNINKNNCKGYSINLKAIRLSKGQTQADLGRSIGFTAEYINMIERGKIFPILETRIKIAKALETDTSAIWILEGRK